MSPQFTRRDFLQKSALGVGGLAIAYQLCEGFASTTNQESAPLPSASQLPALNWQQQSDWLNVQTFGTKGDNIADDTSAIQKALFRLSDESRRGKARYSAVLYFPPRTYRVTRTLTLGPCSGVWLVGHGRDTILRWGGAPGGIMWLSNGAQCMRTEGITWDANDAAAVCVEHCSQSDYETQLRYQSCAFINPTEHGVLIGRGKEKQPSAEFWFVNCVFDACPAGISLLNYNDYDNIFDGCAFFNCGTGINSVNGHFAARGCHFAGSTIVDVRQLAPSHASSLRLCTSKGSRRFFETGSGAHYPMKIQGCHVESWTSKEGAIVLSQRGPTTLFDCVFEKPPGTLAPVRLANPRSVQQLLILSNCTSLATRGIIDEGANSRITHIPAGNRQRCVALPVLHSFRHSPPLNGKCLDAVRDFGAKGDGIHDDSSALQNGIDAARREGQNAVFYLPSGTYRITRTLQVAGANFFISGTGYASILEWAGANDGTMVDIRAPRDITIQHLNFRGPYTVTRIRHIGSTGAGTSIFCDGIYTNGPDWASKDCQGLWCDKLSKNAVIRIGQFVGNIRLTDCGSAEFLCAVHYYCLKLDGATQPKSGMAGFMFHNDAAHNYAVEVIDNQDVLIADFYSESNKRFLLCAGAEGQPTGRITIGCSKMSPTESECIAIRNYEGRIFLGGGDSYNPSRWGQPLEIAHEGVRRVEFAIAGQGWWAVGPRMRFASGLQYASVENLLMENKYPEYSEKSLPNILPPGTEKLIVAAFDDFRELADAYLKNFYT